MAFSRILYYTFYQYILFPWDSFYQSILYIYKYIPSYQYFCLDIFISEYKHEYIYNCWVGIRKHHHCVAVIESMYRIEMGFVFVNKLTFKQIFENKTIFFLLNERIYWTKVFTELTIKLNDRISISIKFPRS